jgi:predicted O-linked N-acetylglucosamine transferase (SPINDLY family)
MWKGWAGTIGADYVPWLISDKVSTPPELVGEQYTEKVM